MIESSVELRAAANQGRLAYIDRGPVPASIYVFGDARAANISTPAASSPLCIIMLATPAGAVNTAGALSLEQLDDGLILAGGLARWCRVFNGDGGACFDMDAGMAGSGAEAIFTTTTLYAGGSLRLLSCVLG